MASPLFQEYIPGTPQKRPQGTGIFIFSLLLLIATLGVWGGLWWYKATLESELDSIAKEVENLEKSVDTDKLKQILAATESLRNARSLLDRHPMVSHIFDFLESTTHPQLQFNTYTFVLNERLVKGIVETIDYRTFAEQVKGLEDSTEVRNVEFSKLQLVNNRLSSEIAIFFRPGILLFK